MAADRRRSTLAVLSSLEHSRAVQAAAFATAPVAVVAPRALAILLPLAAMAAVYAGWRSDVRPRFVATLSLLIAACALWAAASALWAEQPRLVWSALAQFTVMSLAGLALMSLDHALDAKARRDIETGLLAGVAIAWLLLAAEWASGLLLERSIAARFFVREAYPAFIFNRGAAMLALLAWPAALIASRRFGPWSGVATVLAIVVLLTQFESMAALLGLAGGGIVALCALRRPRATALALAVVLAAGTFAAPWIVRVPTGEVVAARGDVSISITHRIKIWRFVSDAIAERAALGWGLNAARELPGRLAPGGEMRIAASTEESSLHPHNVFLQVWVELGVVGAALLTLLLLHAVRAAHRLAGPDGGGRNEAAMALGTLTAGCLVAATGYGIWQAWWLAGLWLAAAFVGALARGCDARTR